MVPGKCDTPSLRVNVGRICLAIENHLWQAFFLVTYSVMLGSWLYQCAMAPTTVTTGWGMIGLENDIVKSQKVE